MQFDYKKEAGRIWAMPTEDFLGEYRNTAYIFRTGRANKEGLELLALKKHHTLPKYYINLHNALFDMLFRELVVIDRENTDELSNSLKQLDKLHVYILLLRRVQAPPYPQFYAHHLDSIEEIIDLFEKRMTT